MNIAIIFAGGVGTRMNSKSQPKQFLELHGKPIIIYTLEVFEQHPDIDGIIISCVADKINYLSKLIKKFEITKVSKIVPGGASGQQSIYNGLVAAKDLYSMDSVVLIHDGVRPIIDEALITKNIESVKKYGSAITVTPARETFVILDKEKLAIPNRSVSLIAKAPQSFVLSDILAAHQKAISEGIYTFIDSCTMMNDFVKKIAVVEGDSSNIKVTDPIDFYLFRAIIDARENSQIFGFSNG
jgi:2-C-methyl-D-erythritol 4-phosphate cytidylyltransferase